MINVDKQLRNGLYLVDLWAVFMFLGKISGSYTGWVVHLGKAGFFGGNIAPLLHNGLFDLPWVGPGPGAHLLGDVNTLLSGLKLGHQLGHMLAGPLGLEVTLLLGGVLDHGLHLVVALLWSFREATATFATDFPGFLGAASDGGVLFHLLLGHPAHLLWPRLAFCGGGVTRSVVFALLLED